MYLRDTGIYLSLDTVKCSFADILSTVPTIYIDLTAHSDYCYFFTKTANVSYLSQNENINSVKQKLCRPKNLSDVCLLNMK